MREATVLSLLRQSPAYQAIQTELVERQAAERRRHVEAIAAIEKRLAANVTELTTTLERDETAVEAARMKYVAAAEKAQATRDKLHAVTHAAASEVRDHEAPLRATADMTTIHSYLDHLDGLQTRAGSLRVAWRRKGQVEDNWGEVRAYVDAIAAAHRHVRERFPLMVGDELDTEFQRLLDGLPAVSHEVPKGAVRL